MSGHPLEELAGALNSMPGLTQQRRDLKHAAAICRSLHPDVARCALALAEGLVVPEGWTVAMLNEGRLIVTAPSAEWAGVFVDRERWVCLPALSRTYHDTPQAAVDAAVKALGGAT